MTQLNTEEEHLRSIRRKLEILCDGEPFDVELYVAEAMRTHHFDRLGALQKLAERLKKIKVF